MKTPGKRQSPTTQVGVENKHGQVVVRSTGLQGTDYNQVVYVLCCMKWGLSF